MSFIDLAEKRVSVRAYESKAVENDKLASVLEAARLAPSACNRQPWRLVVVRSEEARKKVGASYGQEWFGAAPVIIAVCVDTEEAYVRADGRKYADVDASIIMDHITLAACDIGLGTCWIGAFNNDVARSAMNIPESIEIVAMTPLGYAADAGRPKARKDLSEIAYADEFGKPFEL